MSKRTYEPDPKPGQVAKEPKPLKARTPMKRKQFKRKKPERESS